MKIINRVLKTAFALGLIISITATKPFPVKVSFNGSWTLDAAKSDFGGLPKERAAAVLIKLIQNKESVSFERSFQNVPVISKETLTLDGKEFEVKKDEYTALRTLAISEDKKSFTVTSKYHATPEGQEPWDYTRTELYGLTDDGKSMLVTRVMVTPDKTETVKAFYNKVK